MAAVNFRIEDFGDFIFKFAFDFYCRGRFFDAVQNSVRRVWVEH